MPWRVAALHDARWERYRRLLWSGSAPQRGREPGFRGVVARFTGRGIGDRDSRGGRGGTPLRNRLGCTCRGTAPSGTRDAEYRAQDAEYGTQDAGYGEPPAARTRRTHPENRPRARNGRPHAGGRTGLRDATTLRRCAPPPASGRRMTIAPQCVCGLIGVFCQREGNETAAARPYAPPCIELVYRIICGVYAACMRRFRQNARIASRVGCVAA